MRRFETQTLKETDTEVARLLTGMDSRTLELAQDDAAYQRMVTFHNAIHDQAYPVEVAQPDGSVNVYGYQCMSAISLGGQLIGARHRHTTPGEVTTGAYYAVATASLYEDGPMQWREAAHQYVKPDNALELTLDEAPEPRPSLSLVNAAQTAHERAILEAARQEEQERLHLASIRIRLSRTAWSLLKPGYVVEPLQSTYSLMNTVRNARIQGFMPHSGELQVAEEPADIIDNYN